jgi:hypothetical protein
MITIGMLDEPSLVDKASGVELMVALHDEHGATHHDDGDGDEHEDGTPVTGLEATLKVDVIAAGKTKTLSFTPAWGEPGSYGAMFVPTANTTYAFRVYGKINNTDVDLTYTCNPAGHPQSPEDTTEKKLSDDVTQVSHAGAFGCPIALETVTFPDTLSGQAAMATGGGSMAWLGFVTGIVGLALSIVALRKRSA